MKRYIFFLMNFVFSIAIIMVTFIVVFNITNYSYNYAYSITAESKVEDPGAKEVTVVIPKGATTQVISKILYENDLIANEAIFRLQSLINNMDGNYKPGTYSLNSNMDEDKLMDILTTGPTDNMDIKITILEGYTVSQIAELLEKNEVVKAADFIDAANNSVFKYEFLLKIPERSNRLEGYLFPDTYFLNKNSTADEIISKLLKRFEDIYNDELRTRANILGMTMDEVITMASIIEKEIKVPEERELAAGVIYNRLDRNINLQMCSTIMYALGKNKDRLLDADLQVESPYNTYINAGLPVGPICNPGEAAIRAVLYPEATDYLYFVLKDEETGEHVFTDNYDEFLDAKQEYNQKF